MALVAKSTILRFFRSDRSSQKHLGQTHLLLVWSTWALLEHYSERMSFPGFQRVCFESSKDYCARKRSKQNDKSSMDDMSMSPWVQSSMWHRCVTKQKLIWYMTKGKKGKGGGKGGGKGKGKGKGKKRTCRLRASPCQSMSHFTLCATFLHNFVTFDNPNHDLFVLPYSVLKVASWTGRKRWQIKTRRWDSTALSSLKVKDTKWSQPSWPFRHHQICRLLLQPFVSRACFAENHFFVAGCLWLR